MSEARDFLDTLFPLDNPIQWQEAYSAVYNKINKMLRAGEFSKVDDILREYDERIFSSDMAVAFLGYTSQAKAELKERESFWDRVYVQAVVKDGRDTADVTILPLE